MIDSCATPLPVMRKSHLPSRPPTWVASISPAHSPTFSERRRFGSTSSSPSRWAISKPQTAARQLTVARSSSVAGQIGMSASPTILAMSPPCSVIRSAICPRYVFRERESCSVPAAPRRIAAEVIWVNPVMSMSSNAAGKDSAEGSDGNVGSEAM